jgi:hypothetical protein
VTIVDGLKLTLTGDELRKLIEVRAAEHRTDAARWEREGEAAGDRSAGRSEFPQHICEHEAERHDWRARVLSFIRDHLDPSEIYRLAESDLEFAELLPPAPAWLEDEGELGPFAARICDSPEIVQVMNPFASGVDREHMD